MEFEIYADGILWEDGDGRTRWPLGSMATLAAMLESLGYYVTTKEVV